jgi:YD repeat-containing protein
VAAWGQLSSVTWQDGTVRRYHHEQADVWYVASGPHLLTGITDEAGVRYATWAYSGLTSGGVAIGARVSSSEHAGGTDRLEFSYGNNAAGQAVTTITDYSSGSAQQTTQTYTDIGNTRMPVSVSAPCAQCSGTAQATTYNANGQPIKQIAHDSTVTFYLYDAKGRETERAVFPSSYQSATTRPALSAATRVVSTKWHATWNLPIQLAEPSKVTAYTYSSKGNLTAESWTATTDATGAAKFTAVKTGSTYAMGWGYNSNSLLTSLVNKTDGVVTAQVSYVVNAQGIITKATNVLTGKAIAVATSNANGQPNSGIDATGTPFSIAYSLAGKPTSFTIGTQPPSRFIYAANGALLRLEAADGSTVTLGPPITSQSGSASAFASMGQTGALAVINGVALSPISGSASSCLAVGQAAKVASKCCEGAACRVYCQGVPGNAPVFCTRIEYSTGLGWRTTNFGMYSWLDRPFNFVGKFTCAEFDQLLGDGRCANGACLAATTR